MPSNFAYMAKIALISGLILISMMQSFECEAQPSLMQTDTGQTSQRYTVTQRIDSSEIILGIEHQEYFEMMDSLDRATLKSRGYRIQIFSASGPNGRKDALQKQAEFLNLYRESSAYTKWNYPNWVVRLGDFRTQLEALEFHTEIREMYPASFIVKDEIQVD